MQFAQSTVGTIVNLYKKYPELKSKIFVESLNGKFKPIEEAKKTYNGKYYTIINENGDKLECSPDHILFDKNNKEIKVKNIKKNDLIKTRQGTSRIINKYISNNDKDLFDIQVKDTHTYYSNNFLSHNSSLNEAICFCLFGKTIREIEKIDDCINILNKNNLHIELEVDNIKIIRCRKPNKLEVYENEKDITLSSMALTQNFIEEKIGINYHTYINTFCFGQHNNYSFLSAKKQDKRKIIEDILQLSEYNLYEENSRRYSRGIKNKLSNTSEEYQFIKNDFSNKQNQLNDYINKFKYLKEKVKNEINEINEKIKNLENFNIQKEIDLWKVYEESIEKIFSIEKDVNELSQKENKIRKFALEEQNNIQNEIFPIKNELKLIKNDLSKIESLKDGVKCNNCFQEIKKENYNIIKNDLEEKYNHLLLSLKNPEEKYKKIKNLEINETEKIKKQINNFLSTKEKIKIIKPSLSKESLSEKKSEKLILENLLQEKQKSINENPYESIILDLKNKLLETENILNDKENIIKQLEDLSLYYNFWVKGFSDTGIKSFVIERIIQVLNQQINYWLQFLIDNKIIVNFDKFLNVEIKRSDNLGNFSYNQASGGEKKRIDLAITLAFAYITKLRSNTFNNIIFLDELAESIDNVDGIRKMLMELSKECTVFLITHRQDLLSDLENKKKLIIRKENGYSRLILS